MSHYKEKNIRKLRVIKTARNMDEINKAVKDGFYPLVKPVVPSYEVSRHISITQHKVTGEIRHYPHPRYMDNFNPNDYNSVVSTSYYPYHFEEPYAAYLIPDDIELNELVFVEDIIEDISSGSNGARLESCEAIWNGRELEIQFDLETDYTTYIG